MASTLEITHPAQQADTTATAAAAAAPHPIAKKAGDADLSALQPASSTTPIAALPLAEQPSALDAVMASATAAIAAANLAAAETIAALAAARDASFQLTAHRSPPPLHPPQPLFPHPAAIRSLPPTNTSDPPRVKLKTMHQALYEIMAFLDMELSQQTSLRQRLRDMTDNDVTDFLDSVYPYLASKYTDGDIEALIDVVDNVMNGDA